jgi:hypothetical protein
VKRESKKIHHEGNEGNEGKAKGVLKQIGGEKAADAKRSACLNPSPIGRGAGVRVGAFIDVDRCSNPHPALRATFSRWEKGKT